MDYDTESPLGILTGVLPMDAHGAIVRCRVWLKMLEALEFHITLDAHKVKDHQDHVEYQFLVPEFHVGEHFITRIEISRCILIGKKLVETPFVGCEEEDYPLTPGAPSVIYFQDKKVI